MQDIFRIFHVGSTGYYNWVAKYEDKDGKRKAKEVEKNRIKECMLEIIKKLSFIPGKRTFKTHLWRDYGINVNIKRLKRIMDEMNLAPNKPKKDAYKGQATHFHECDAKQNLVARNFGETPRSVILTDITYLMYGKNRTTCYLCVFRDAFTHEILGYYLSRHMDITLVTAAYDRMMNQWGEELKHANVLIHSDQGSQYLSTTFKQILEDDGLIQSTSRRGNSQDNAPMESFFGRMKCEILDIIALCPDFETVEKLIDGYMNSYNNERYQYNLAGLTPSEFYQYKKTGIYPLDNYFGVKSTELMTVKQLVEIKLEKLKEAREKARLKKADEEKKLEPAHILVRDAKKVRKEIKKWENAQRNAENQIKKLEELQKKITEASNTYFHSEDKANLRELLSNPLEWRNQPPFDYVTQLGAIY